MSTEENKLTVMPPNGGFESGGMVAQSKGMIEGVVARQLQEVQAAMFIAKQFPRNQLEAYQRILNACARPGLAEESTYCFPRGGQQVTGPSIRLAEMLAQNWGNLDFGITELEQRPAVGDKPGESIVMAYCWDTETNTRQVKIFTVPHVREKRGGNEALKDPRDIYEMVANQGARRLRSCILGIIPGDVIEDALKKCEETLTNKDKGAGPLVERIKALSLHFQKQGVTVEMMEMRVGKKSDAWTEFDYSTLKKIFLTIRDGHATKESFFSYQGMKEGEGAPAPQTAAPNMAPPKQPRAPKQPAQKPPEQPAPQTPAPEIPTEPAKEPEQPAAGAKQPPELNLSNTPAGSLPMSNAEKSVTTPLDQVIHLIKTTSGVDSTQVFDWLSENRVTAKAVSRLNDLTEDHLRLLVEKWATVVADIRGD